MELNVALAITNTLKVKYKNMVSDFSRFFTKSQGAFTGVKNTYTPKEGTVDDPSKRAYQKIQTTVDEKLDWFISNSKEFIDALFAQEKTNASGNVKAELIVNNKSWGEYTSLELLRLKALLESKDLGDLNGMLENIPVRTDSVIWNKTDAEEYVNRDVWETERTSGVAKTTVKEEYILKDPNVASGNMEGYVPQVAVRTTTSELGDYTHQIFSGQWSQRQRAEALKRRFDLYTAVIQTLEKCNKCKVVQSDLTAEKIFSFIFKGD